MEDRCMPAVFSQPLGVPVFRSAADPTHCMQSYCQQQPITARRPRMGASREGVRLATPGYRMERRARHRRRRHP